MMISFYKLRIPWNAKCNPFGRSYSRSIQTIQCLKNSNIYIKNRIHSNILLNDYENKKNVKSVSIYNDIIRRWYTPDDNIKKPKKENIFNIPNALTVGRIIATPYLSWLILDGQFEYAMGVFAIAGFSDWLDGYIAKNFKQQSVLGSFLDPLADKLMVSMLSISLASVNAIPPALVAVMLSRDLVLIGGTIYHRAKTKKTEDAFFSTTSNESFQVQPSLLSKVNTLLQFSMLGFAISNSAWHIPNDFTMNSLFVLVAGTTIGSGVSYSMAYLQSKGAFQNVLKKAKKIRQQRKERKEKRREQRKQKQQIK